MRAATVYERDPSLQTREFLLPAYETWSTPMSDISLYILMAYATCISINLVDSIWDAYIEEMIDEKV